MSGQSFFRVIVRNFKAKNLPAKDSNGLSDPYLQCNFDNFRKFKTETIKNDLNPEWKFSLEFLYDTIYPDKLDKKNFRIECYDKDTFGSDDFIGVINIDLLTLASGPMKHELTLRDGSKPAGVLSFELIMEQLGDVYVTFKEIQITGLPSFQDGSCDPYLVYRYGSAKDAKSFKSTTVKGSTNPSWKDADQMCFKATLRELLSEQIFLTVKHNKKLDIDPDLAFVPISISKYLFNATNQPLLIKEGLTRHGTTSEPAGTFQALIFFTGVPKFAQFEGGIHTDFGMNGGKPLASHLPVPKSFVANQNPPKVLSSTDLSKPTATNTTAPTMPHPPVVSPTSIPVTSTSVSQTPFIPTPLKPIVTVDNSAPVQQQTISNGPQKPEALYSMPSNTTSANHYFSTNFTPDIHVTHPDVSAPTPLQLKSSVLASLAVTKLNNISHNSSTSGNTVAPSQPSQSSQSVTSTNGGLPSGWEQKVDPSSGRTFYVHHDTQTTHWNLPSWVTGNSTNTTPTTTNIVPTTVTSQPSTQYPSSSVINFSTTATIPANSNSTPFSNNPYVNPTASPSPNPTTQHGSYSGSSSTFAPNPYISTTPYVTPQTNYPTGNMSYPYQSNTNYQMASTTYPTHTGYVQNQYPTNGFQGTSYQNPMNPMDQFGNNTMSSYLANHFPQPQPSSNPQPQNYPPTIYPYQ